MAFTDTQENLTGLNIHKLSLAAYQYLADNNQLDEDAIYLIEDDGGFDSELNSTSENAPQTKIVYAALDNKVDKVSGKGLSTNDYTTTEKNKLAGIAASANNYTHPSYTAQANGLYKITVDASGHVSAVTAATKDDITGLGVPAAQPTKTSELENDSGYVTDSDMPFIVTVDFSGTSAVADKTYAELEEAYNANKQLLALVIDSSGNKLYYPLASKSTDAFMFDFITVKADSYVIDVVAVTSNASNSILNVSYPFGVYYPNGVTVDRALYLNSYGFLATSDTTTKELGYLSGVTSNVQTQIDELKNSVSDGKTLVANAITAKGVTTATDSTFQAMVDNILALSTAKVATGSYTRTSTASSPTSITLGIDFTPDVVFVIAKMDDLAKSNYNRTNVGYMALKMTRSGTSFTFYATAKSSSTEYYIYGSDSPSGVTLESEFSYNDTTKVITLASFYSNGYTTSSFNSGYYWIACKN